MFATRASLPTCRQAPHAPRPAPSPPGRLSHGDELGRGSEQGDPIMPRLCVVFGKRQPLVSAQPDRGEKPRNARRSHREGAGLGTKDYADPGPAGPYNGANPANCPAKALCCIMNKRWRTAAHAIKAHCPDTHQITAITASAACGTLRAALNRIQYAMKENRNCSLPQNFLYLLLVVKRLIERLTKLFTLDGHNE
jgi:hypothetical protein